MWPGEGERYDLRRLQHPNIVHDWMRTSWMGHSVRSATRAPGSAVSRLGLGREDLPPRVQTEYGPFSVSPVSLRSGEDCKE